MAGREEKRPQWTETPVQDAYALGSTIALVACSTGEAPVDIHVVLIAWFGQNPQGRA